MRSKLISSAFLVALLGTTQASAFDPNTFEALVIIEPDEEAFIFIGKRISRHLKPGWHRKMPFIEQVGVITTNANRYATIARESRVTGGIFCEGVLDARYVVSDARRAFRWRQEHDLDTRQQRELFKSPRDDYTEPAERMEAALDDVLRSLTPRQASCGRGESWARLDPRGLLGTVNADGTEINQLYLNFYCDMDEPPECTSGLPINRSSFSSARDNPHHR